MHFERDSEPPQLALVINEAMTEMLCHVARVVEAVQILAACRDERRRVFPFLLRRVDLKGGLRHHIGQDVGADDLLLDAFEQHATQDVAAFDHAGDDEERRLVRQRSFLVGISGDLSEQDEACAVVGIKAAGLVPDTGETG